MIEYLVALGVSAGAIEEARRDDRLVTAGFQHFVSPPGTLTLSQLAEQAGVPVATAIRILRGVGLPPPPSVEPAAQHRRQVSGGPGASPRLGRFDLS